MGSLDVIATEHEICYKLHTVKYSHDGVYVHSTIVHDRLPGIILSNL